MVSNKDSHRCYCCCCSVRAYNLPRMDVSSLSSRCSFHLESSRESLKQNNNNNNQKENQKENQKGVREPIVGQQFLLSLFSPIFLFILSPVFHSLSHFSFSLPFVILSPVFHSLSRFSFSLPFFFISPLLFSLLTPSIAARQWPLMIGSRQFQQAYIL